MHGLRVLLVIASMLPWCATRSAEPLGRLFFTPAQRNALDAGKQVATPRAAARPRPRTVRLNGVVTRSDGETTVWLNGKPDPDAHIRVPSGRDARVTVPLVTPGGQATLKVGQSLDPSTGKITESYVTAQEPSRTPSAPATTANQTASPTTLRQPPSVNSKQPDTPADGATPEK